MPDSIVLSVQRELRRGAPTPVVRRLAAETWRELRPRPKAEVLARCEDLLRSGVAEDQVVAFDWAFRLRRLYEREDFERFQRWLERHVHGWGGCDDLCTHPLGALVLQFPETVPAVVGWSAREGRWLRRAAAVALIYGVRRGKYLEAIFDVSDRLLRDEDDLVRKGYGWALKEAANRFEDEVLSFVLARRERMPRVALRYAVEKMPAERRREAQRQPWKNTIRPSTKLTSLNE